MITIRGPLNLPSMQTLSTSLVPVVRCLTPAAAMRRRCSSRQRQRPADTEAVGESYYAALAPALGVIGGRAALLVATGALPAGLTLNANGTLTGTPTQGGSTTATITVTDARRRPSAQTGLTLTSLRARRARRSPSPRPRPRTAAPSR